jgi:hypothetical protein
MPGQCQNAVTTMLRVAVLTMMVVGAATVETAQSRVDTSPRAVLQKATEHRTRYQEALQFVIADEATVQEVVSLKGTRLARRETTAEFFLAYVAGDGGWLAVRDMVTVDGKPVEDREDLRALLNRGSIARIGRAVADRNSRYNIGTVARNFNDPMLALVILDSKHQSRFRFAREAVTQEGDTTLVTLSFEERDRPTLIRGSDGAPIFTRGTLVLNAATGELHQSKIEMRDRRTSASLTTTFEFVEKLKLRLPAMMDESYRHDTADRGEIVNAASTYSNYREFSVSVRIR